MTETTTVEVKKHGDVIQISVDGPQSEAVAASMLSHVMKTMKLWRVDATIHVSTERP